MESKEKFMRQLNNLGKLNPEDKNEISSKDKAQITEASTLKNL